MRRRSRRLAPTRPTRSSAMGQSPQLQQNILQRQEDQLDVISGLRASPSLQTQLERADRLGHHFSQVPVLSTTPQVMGQRATGAPFVQRLEATEEEPQIRQAREAQGSETQGSGANHLESQLSSAQGGGTPLSEETRRFMEPRFGADFSGVRIHTGGEAVQMSRALGAQAFTHGSDIFFNSGKFETQSKAGRQLLAHELTHVLQQQGPGQISAKEMDESSAQPSPGPAPQADSQDGDPRRTAADLDPEHTSPVPPEMEVEDDIDQIAQDYVPPRQAFVREDMKGMFNDTANVRGEVDDCYELAKMRAVAQESPEDIKKRVQDNYDGTYTITIFVRDTGAEQKIPLTQVVDGILPVGQPGRDFFSSEQMISPPEPEFWAMLVEKAYAMHMRGQGQVEGGTVARSLQMLTGMSEFPVDRLSEKQLISILGYTVSNRVQVNATSQNFQGKSQSLQDEANSNGLPMASRSNFKIERANGSLTILNPFGPTLEMSMERFKRFFSSFTVR